MSDPSNESGMVRIPGGYACGKVILLGEHAVVYGVPAIAAGIEHGVSAQAHRLDRGPSTLSVPQWRVSVKVNDPDSGGPDGPESGRDLALAFGAILAATGDVSPVSVEAKVDLPPGSGLGCSAALGVAIARAVDPAASADVIAERVMAWERVFHGNPSGIDGACAAHGGCVYYTKGEGIAALNAGAPLTVCIGNTGTPSSTKTMVDSVAKLKARRPEIVEKAFEGITSLVRNARLAIEAGDRFALGRLMDLNQMILSGLFVSTEEIERLCGLARDAGAYGAKLTGAGGGGCVVALVNGTAGADAVLGAWRTAGFQGFATRVARTERREAHAGGGAP